MCKNCSRRWTSWRSHTTFYSDAVTKVAGSDQLKLFQVQGEGGQILPTLCYWHPHFFHLPASLIVIIRKLIRQYATANYACACVPRSVLNSRLFLELSIVCCGKNLLWILRNNRTLSITWLLKNFFQEHQPFSVLVLSNWEKNLKIIEPAMFCSGLQKRKVDLWRRVF